MKNRKALIALLALMAMSFLAVGSLSAQTPPEDELNLEEVNPQNEAELQVLLVTLGERYEVDLVVLTGLIDEGYDVQESWLALEIQKATGSTLEEALIKADGTDGHGWGVLAHALGIKPGSAEFMELKGKIAKGDEGGTGRGKGKGKD